MRFYKGGLSIKIVLISCVSKKAEGEMKAKDLYISPLFKGAYKYARKLQADRIFILSAKYHLVDENEVIKTYDETLNGKSAEFIKKWTDKVVIQLKEICDIENDEFVILAGENYRKYLVNYLVHCTIPLKGKGIGEQLKFYKNI